MTGINEPARNLITKWEGVRLEPYKDLAGKVTWGIGHKYMPGEVIPEHITQEQVQTQFERDLQHASDLIDRFITAPLTGNQRGALCSLVFNCGKAPLEDGLGRVLNRRDYIGCAHHFLLWDKYTDKDGELQVSEGLQQRREEERDLFLTPDCLTNGDKNG